MDLKHIQKTIENRFGLENLFAKNRHQIQICARALFFKLTKKYYTFSELSDFSGLDHSTIVSHVNKQINLIQYYPEYAEFIRWVYLDLESIEGGALVMKSQLDKLKCTIQNNKKRLDPENSDQEYILYKLEELESAIVQAEYKLDEYIKAVENE